MQATLIRRPSANGATIGSLYVNGQLQCLICEDVVRPYGQYVYGQTAIPTGTYRVVIDRSQRFSARAGHDVFLPRLVDIPGKVRLFGGRPVGECGIRIHGGNRPEDSEGCLLTGSRAGADGRSVEASQAALAPLIAKIHAALAAGEDVLLTVQ